MSHYSFYDFNEHGSIKSFYLIDESRKPADFK